MQNDSMKTSEVYLKVIINWQMQVTHFKEEVEILLDIKMEMD